jgi:AcrR family transcriptional regulator
VKPGAAKPAARGRSRTGRGANNSADEGSTARQTIMRVATAHFQANGYRKTTMADLAAEAGTSVGLLYYHFESKEALFFAIWSEYQAEQAAGVRQALRAARSNGVDDPVQLLIVSVRAYLEGAWAHREQYWMVHERDLPPRLVDARRQSGERWRQRNAKALSSSNRTLSRVMMSTVSGFLTEVSLEVVKCRNDTEARAVIDEAMFLFDSLLRTFVAVRDEESGGASA